MSTTAIRTVTAFSLLLHAVLGCCVHHAHGCESHAHLQNGVVADVHHFESPSVCGYQIAGEHEEDHASCNESVCVYRIDASPQIIGSWPCVDQTLDVARSAATCVNLLNSFGTCAELKAPPLSGAALRAHFRVWRI